jgi:hypothetical protein
MKNSTAYELWEAWQKETKDRNAAQKKLDSHMKQLDQNELDLIKRYDTAQPK